MCFEPREDAPIFISKAEEVIKGDLTAFKFTHKRFLAICNELLDLYKHAKEHDDV